MGETNYQTSLRPVEESDLPVLAAWINDPEVVAYTSPYEPVSMSKQQEWFDNLTSDRNTTVFGIQETKPGRLIGTCGLYGIHWKIRKAELRMRIGEKSAWGQGFGTDATRQLVDFGFRDMNLHRIYLYVFATNERAIRVYEKCGFVREGLLKDEGFIRGEYLDVVVMGMTR